MSKKSNATMMVLIMAFMSLSGCFGEDEVEIEGEEDNDAVRVITAPAPLCDLARRPPGSWGHEQNVEVEQVGEMCESTDILSRDYREVCMAKSVS